MNTFQQQGQKSRLELIESFRSNHKNILKFCSQSPVTVGRVAKNYTQAKVALLQHIDIQVEVQSSNQKNYSCKNVLDKSYSRSEYSSLCSEIISYDYIIII